MTEQMLNKMGTVIEKKLEEATRTFAPKEVKMPKSRPQQKEKRSKTEPKPRGVSKEPKAKREAKQEIEMKNVLERGGAQEIEIYTCNMCLSSRSIDDELAMWEHPGPYLEHIEAEHNITPEVGILGSSMFYNLFSHVLFKGKLIPFGKHFKTVDYAPLYYFWKTGQYNRLYICPCQLRPFTDRNDRNCNMFSTAKMYYEHIVHAHEGTHQPEGSHRIEGDGSNVWAVSQQTKAWY